MHLYVVTRGIKNFVDQFITELQGKYLPFTWNGEDRRIQVAVRPIQLWEVVFPEEHKDVMLTTILGDHPNVKGKPQHKWQEKYVWMLKKALKLQDIPDYKTDKWLPISRCHMECVGIGLKDDRKENGNEML